MRNLKLVTFVVLCCHLFPLITCDQENDDVETDFLFIDRTNYIDPHDMLNYERTPSPKTPVEACNHGECQETTIVKRSSRLLHKPPMDKQEDQIIKNETPSQPVSENRSEKQGSHLCPCNKTGLEKEKPFLSRFVNVLVKVLELEDKNLDDDDILHIPLSAVVTKRSQFILSQIIKGGEDIQLKSLADLDQVLSTIFVVTEKVQFDQEHLISDSIFNRILNAFFLRPKVWLVAMFIASVWLTIWMTFKGFSYFYIIYRLFFPLFMMGWFWHWNYMDQIASAKHQSNIMKNSKVPANCDRDTFGSLESSILHIKKSLFGLEDPCEEYHRALMLDPSYEVNPFIALFDLVVRIAFQPLGYLGEKVGSFFQGVMSSAGWVEKIPVLLAVLAVLCFLLLMVCGYEIHLPFIKIGPSARSVNPAIQTLTTNNALEDTTRPHYVKRTTVRRIHSQVQTLTSIEEDESPTEDSVEELACSTSMIEELTGRDTQDVRESTSTVEVISVSSTSEEVETKDKTEDLSYIKSSQCDNSTTKE